MVRGIGKFREYFTEFPGNYIIIGGTACDLLISEAGLRPRATKDIDIILIVEALKPKFVSQFWKFIKDGDYQTRQKSEEVRKYYRFDHPVNNDFPLVLELFSRNPEIFDLAEDTHLTPIPVDDDLSSLSAILMNEDYYRFTLNHSSVHDQIHIANTEALICLKAKAFLEISDRIAKGSKEDGRQLKKHKADVFRLAVMLSGNIVIELPESIKNDFDAFAKTIANDLPDKALFKEMGLGNVNVNDLFENIMTIFGLK
jgi:hypothetical protein